MKIFIVVALLLLTTSLTRAFVVPLTFEQKCHQADAILEIVVEEIEKTELTKGMNWQFKGLARCKVISSFKGQEEWDGQFIFIPCDYEFDESPCDIEQGKHYVVFVETMGNFSRFGHPLSALCCHLVSDGKVSPEYSGEGAVDMKAFAMLVTSVLASKEFGAANPAKSGD